MPEIEFSHKEQAFHVCLAGLVVLLVVSVLGLSLLASHEQAHSDQLTKYRFCHRINFSVPTAVQALFGTETLVENDLCDAKTSREFEHSNVTVLSDVFLAGPESDVRFLSYLGLTLTLMIAFFGPFAFAAQDSRAMRLLILYALAIILGGIIVLVIGLWGINGALFKGDVHDLISLGTFSTSSVTHF